MTYCVCVWSSSYWFLADFANGADAPSFAWVLDRDRALRFQREEEAIVLAQIARHFQPDSVIKIHEIRLEGAK